MANLTLEAQSREITGRKVRQLRRGGMVPVVIYGKEQDPENAKIESKAFEKVLSTGGTSKLIEVNIEGLGVRNVLIRELQRDPVRHHLMHADLYAVNMTEMQRVSVPIVQVGRPLGQNVELVLVQGLDHVEIEALPADIPSNVEVDVSRLESPEDEPITVSELPSIPGVTYITPGDEALFSLVITRVAIEEEEEEEELLGVPEEVEPEVIGRGKEEEDFEEAEE